MVLKSLILILIVIARHPSDAVAILFFTPFTFNIYLKNKNDNYKAVQTSEPSNHLFLPLSLGSL
jgi:hypothetical protein